MKVFKLTVITPKKIVLEKEVVSVSAPSVNGEITVLAHHQPLFSQLIEGVVRIKTNETEEDFLAIGGGYLETNGESVNILVSRAYGQDEIDEKLVNQAREQAEKLIKEGKTEEDRKKAMAVLRRSLLDLKILKMRRKKYKSV